MLTSIRDYLGYRVWIRDTSYSVRRIYITGTYINPRKVAR